MMATRNTPRPHNAALARLRSGLSIVGQALLLIAFLGVLWGYVWIAYALMNAPDSTERCFGGATTEMTYCREQMTWE